MLKNLYVKNLALIDETEVEFTEGLNILTGETGAGKSLLLGSVNLALGGKYSADMLRNGTRSGLVEITFTVDDEKTVKRLEELDIYPEDGCIVLGRKLMEGRSVSRINGEKVNMTVLRAVAGLLIDIHGQHDSQNLLQKKNHLSLLDLYAKQKTSPLLEKMRSAFEEYRRLCRKKEESAVDEEGRRKEAALAEFEIKEIEEAQLTPGEDEELEEEYRRMTESRRITSAVAEASIRRRMQEETPVIFSAVRYGRFRRHRSLTRREPSSMLSFWRRTVFSMISTENCRNTRKVLSSLKRSFRRRRTG